MTDNIPLFLELANLSRITPEWIAEKHAQTGFQGGLPLEGVIKGFELVRREIQAVCSSLLEGKRPSRFSLRVLRAFAHTIEGPGPLGLNLSRLNALYAYGLDHTKGHVSLLALRAAKECLDFYQTDKNRLRQCKHPLCAKLFLHRKREYCTDECKDDCNRRISERMGS